MKLNKDKIIKKYGKSRCASVHFYMDRLNKGYNFPNSEEALYGMVIDFEEYSSADFSASYKKLDAMEFYGAIKRSHIRKACEEAKTDRIREKKLKETPPVTKGCPMPDHIKKKIAKILSKN